MTTAENPDHGGRRSLAFGTLVAALAASALLSAPVLEAQELRLGMVQSWPGNSRLGSPTGVVVSGGTRPFGRFGFRQAYEFGKDRFHTFGSTCVGLIPPEEVPGCEPEDQREVATLQSVSFSAPWAVHTRERLEISLVPTFRWSWFESERTGVTSDRELDADESMWGFGLGGEILVQPFSGAPLRLFLGAHAGFLGQTEYESIADGYSPFDEGFSLTQVEVGIVYRQGG
jgi:hypothetical protein